MEDMKLLFHRCVSQQIMRSCVNMQLTLWDGCFQFITVTLSHVGMWPCKLFYKSR